MLFVIRILIGILSLSVPLLVKKDYFKRSQILIGITWLLLLIIGPFKGFSQEDLTAIMLFFFHGWTLGSLIAFWNHMQVEIEEARLLHERLRHKKE